MYNLDYINLSDLLRSEKSQIQNQFSNNLQLSIHEIFNLFSRYRQNSKTKLSGFCFNIDFVPRSKFIQKALNLKIPDTSVRLFVNQNIIFILL